VKRSEKKRKEKKRKETKNYAGSKTLPASNKEKEIHWPEGRSINNSQRKNMM
jgi:hypothetical protein